MRKCEKCGEPLHKEARWSRKYCLMCRPKQKFCKDCDDPISSRAERCHGCANRVPERRQQHSMAMDAAWERGAYDSEKTRRKISKAKKAHWAQGLYDSEETKRKSSEAIKAAHARGDFSSEETWQKKSEASKAAWERGAHDEHSEKLKAAWERGVYDGQSQRVKTDWEQGVYDGQSERLKAAHARGDFSSEEIKQKKAAKRRAAWERGVYAGQSQRVRKAWEQGVYSTEEVKRKRSETAMSNWKKGLYDNRDTEEYRQKLSKGVIAAWDRGCFDGVFQSPTTIEIELSSALDICGIEHKSQYRPDGYRCVYDEFVPPNILIEAHGDYWHGPEKPEQQTRDTEKAAWAQENSYSLIVMWEHEIRSQGAWSLVIERVLPLIQGRKQCAVSS